MIYTVAELIEFAKGKPVVTVRIDQFTWMYTSDRISKKRLAGIVIDGFPIIVTKQTDGRFVTLDGFHRVYKAWKEGRTTIKAVVLTPADIEKLKRESTVSTEDKNEAKEIGEDIQRIREFGESKDLPEETINDFIKDELKEHHEKNSIESWLEQQGPGSDDKVYTTSVK